MKILFLGGLYPKQRYKEIQFNSKRSFQPAANNLQWAYVDGLSHFPIDLAILTAPFISTFPFGYKEFCFRGGQKSRCTNADLECISFINLPVINTWSIKRNLKRELRKWSKAEDGRKGIIIYALQAHLMSAATEIKKEFPGLILCQIVADLPEFMEANPMYRFLGLKRKSTGMIYKCLKDMDCFVLLSEHMKERIDLNNRPWVRVEGMFPEEEVIENPAKDKHKTILYTGALSARYGIGNLIKAFSMIDNPEYQLWICGDGEMKMQIIKAAHSDNRIRYFGILPFQEVKSLQRKATVLINPRTADGEYTKYSFPSKTMEYLASATPVILYKLPGIPEEYFEYAIVPENESIECLKQTILDICTKSMDDLEQIGRKASHFINSQKNPTIQVKKILEMIDKI